MKALSTDGEIICLCGVISCSVFFVHGHTSICVTLQLYMCVTHLALSNHVTSIILAWKLMYSLKSAVRKMLTTSDMGMFIIFLLCVASGQMIPEQIHLSFGDTEDTMVVMWATHLETQGFVRFGMLAEAMNVTAKSTTSVLQSDNQQALKFIHRAEMKELEPGTIYHYQVYCMTSGTQEKGSVIYSFHTPKLQQNKTKVLLYGDLGAVAGVTTFPVLENEVRSGQYDAVWHIGDFAYDMHSNGGKTGDDFLRNIERVAARIPYMTSPGNHELANDLHHYRTRFSMPRSGWPMEKEKLWYSYNIGPVHFISYSTEVYFMDNQNGVCQQYYWLLQDLIKANKNRHIQPWIIAMGHRPMYCSNEDSDDCTDRLFGHWVKYGLEDLFYAQGVDLVIQAHEHSYERLWPVYDRIVKAKNYTDPKAPVHIISGAAGCNEGVDRMGKPGPWSAFQADERSSHSYGRLFVHNATHIFFEQVHVSPKKVLDSFWLIQNNHGPNIKDINCDASYFKRHFTCTCPLPFHYITVAAVIGVLLVLCLIASVSICCWCCKRKRCCVKKYQNGFQLLHNLHVQESDEKLLISDDMDDDII